MDRNQNKPLSGIKVVELATFVAATVPGRLMADMGAEVIKIEGPKGDPWRVLSRDLTNTTIDEIPDFDVFNLGKRSICLDLKKPEGLAFLEKLLESADVFITNTRQQSLVKMGLDVATLRAKYPNLIYANVTGYGEKGPQRNDPGFDNVAFWTKSGFRMDMITKTPGSYPLGSPTGGGDSVTGSILFGEIMLALYQRAKTGCGDHVSVSLFNAGLWTFCGPIIEAQDKYKMKFPKERLDSLPVNTVYECADGEWISVTILDYGRLAPKFYALLGITEAIEKIGAETYGESNAKSAEIIPLIEASIATKTSQEWMQLLKEADIVCGLGNHFSDATKSEQAWANEYLQEHTCRNGSVCIVPTSPYRLDSCGVAPSRLAPLPGEHSQEVLKEYGYSAEKIAQLYSDGTVC